MDKKIFRLALPNIITNITVPLLGMIDIAIAGRLGSAVYIGAIALGATIFNMIYWNFGFLRMSSSGFASQALGARNFTGYWFGGRSIDYLVAISYWIARFRADSIGSGIH